VMLQAHNVPSDHSIGCEFYEGHRRTGERQP
jgi:hypothetical protein